MTRLELSILSNNWGVVEACPNSLCVVVVVERPQFRVWVNTGRLRPPQPPILPLPVKSTNTLNGHLMFARGDANSLLFVECLSKYTRRPRALGLVPDEILMSGWWYLFYCQKERDLTFNLMLCLDRGEKMENRFYFIYLFLPPYLFFIFQKKRKPSIPSGCG